jgi:hypothetical protein
VRWLAGVLGLGVATALALSACTAQPPPARGPRSPVERLIGQMRYQYYQLQPAPTARPLPSDRLCVEAYEQRRADLPGMVSAEVAALDPADLAFEHVASAFEAAADSARIGFGWLAVMWIDSAPGGPSIAAVTWCAPYGGTDVYVLAAGQQAWLVAQQVQAGASFEIVWLDGVWLVWNRTGRLPRVAEVWIIEQVGADWVAVSEARHWLLGDAGLGSLPEVTFLDDGDAARLELVYRLPDGTLVERTYVEQAGRYVQVGD